MNSDTDKRYTYYEVLKNLYSFWKQAGNAHDIHSPFLYDLYTKVIKVKSDKESIREAMLYRSELLCDWSKIKYHSYGNASGTILEKSIRHIVASQSSSLKKAMLLNRLVSHFQPLTILELGTNLGVGTMFLASGMKKGELFSLEGSPELHMVTAERLKKMPVKGLKLIRGEFSRVLPGLLKEISGLDFVFFDGDHKYRATLDYFSMCKEKINNNTVFVFDDIHWSGGMSKAWKDITNDPDVTMAVDLFYLGIVFFRKELSKQFFCLRF